ncbi:hypothetical protein FF38_11319 [Lucilia cuprina]|uniref:Tetraspanin n=1 Tax=Lucilia cuprina TaxID=7375 RepID=A0A0L0BXQ0_LUCCU|nr:CD63 antigen [Lucilia cuprina]KNC24044.1 hypothetical protein FF38_11319 [Lucilia cuprina]
MFVKHETKYSKYTVFGINLVLLFSAIGLLITGFYVTRTFSEYDRFLIPEFRWFSISSFFMGVIIAILSLCACWATLKESYCITLTFSILLALSSLLTLAIGIFSYLLRPHILNLITYPMSSALKSYDPVQVNVETFMWDYLQKSFSCCGLFNSSDWQYLSNDLLPLSCCSMPSGAMGNFTCTYFLDDTNRYQSGCLIYFSFYIESQFTNLGNAGIAITFIMFIGIILVTYFARAFKNPYILANAADRIYYLSK